MKYLFFLLLLCNIVFYLWEIGVRGGGTDPASARARPDREGAPIALVKELPEAPMKKAPPPVAAIDAGTPAPEATAVAPAEAQTPQATVSKADESAPPDEIAALAGAQAPALEQGGPATALPAQPLAEASPAADAPPVETPRPSESQAPASAAQPPSAPEKPAAEEAEPVMAAPEPAREAAAPPAPAETAEKIQAPPPQTASAPADAEAACYLHGPYDSQRQAQAALATLQAKPEQAKIVSRPAEIPEAYMILYPKAETPEAARANRKTLAEKGVADAWVVDKGENRNAVSLAVFRNKSHADEALLRFQEKGIAAELVPRLGKTLSWWLKIPWSADRASLETLIGKARPELGWKACDAQPP
jgi:hypothetical protein